MPPIPVPVAGLPWMHADADWPIENKHMQYPIRGRHLAISLLALGLAAAGGVHAQDEAGAWTLPAAFSVSGFGTVGVVHSSEAHADFTSSVLKNNGAGATRRWSGDVDSRLGLQFGLALNKRWSAVLQLVSEQGLDNSYRPRVEWANVKYQATPELALRLGRVALPMFLTAEYRKVGYIYPWVRPPVEGYDALPFTSGDGVDANLRWNLGPVCNTSQVLYGHADEKLGASLHVLARGLVGLANTGDWGALSVRASLISGQVSTDIASRLFDAFDASGPAGAALTRNYALDHKRISVASIGASYDPGRWFLMAEASQRHTRSLLGATRSVYASAGWRHDAFTPYLTWSHVRAIGPTSEPGLLLAGMSAAAAARAAALNAGLNALLATIPQQTSVSAGLRWDLHANTALKLQYDRLSPHAGSRGTLINLTPGFRSGGTIHVASLAVDFVY
jgi:hypothetical protein